MMLWWDERAVKVGNGQQHQAQKKDRPEVAVKQQDKPKPKPKPKAKQDKPKKNPQPPTSTTTKNNNNKNTSHQQLLRRQREVLDKISAAERKIDLFYRQSKLLESIGALEDRCCEKGESNESHKEQADGGDCLPECPPDASETHKKIHSELAEKSIGAFEICRVPSDYYERDLEYRRQCLQGLSVSHLCKSMVMENTKDERQFPEGLPEGEEDLWDSKYFMVIVQYVSRLNAEKIRDHIFDMRKGKTPRKKIKMRLAPAEVSYAITGYDHNAVTPINTKRKIPILLSHSIADLKPDFFWLGAGEVLLKVGFSASKFAQAYGAHVMKCTYD